MLYLLWKIKCIRNHRSSEQFVFFNHNTLMAVFIYFFWLLHSQFQCSPNVPSRKNISFCVLPYQVPSFRRVSLLEEISLVYRASHSDSDSEFLPSVPTRNNISCLSSIPLWIKFKISASVPPRIHISSLSSVSLRFGFQISIKRPNLQKILCLSSVPPRHSNKCI